MLGKAKLLGHPIHQMLVVFPLGLLTTAVAFDLVAMALNSQSMTLAAYRVLTAGLIGGLLAAPFGLIDWLSIPRGTRAKRIGALHAGGNVVVLLLFGASLWLRPDTAQLATGPAYALSFAGVLLMMATAWLGGELVDRLGVGVYNDANVDAPSSLHAPPHRMPQVPKV